MIEGARRIGKSTVAEEFAPNEYKSYIIIDFNKAREAIKYFVADGRYDYIETGSLISITEGFVNVLFQNNVE